MSNSRRMNDALKRQLDSIPREDRGHLSESSRKSSRTETSSSPHQRFNSSPKFTMDGAPVGTAERSRQFSPLPFEEKKASSWMSTLRETASAIRGFSSPTHTPTKPQAPPSPESNPQRSPSAKHFLSEQPSVDERKAESIPRSGGITPLGHISRSIAAPPIERTQMRQPTPPLQSSTVPPLSSTLSPSSPKILPLHGYDKPPPIPFAGVANVGNTCYASSVVTLLLRMPMFTRGLREECSRLRPLVPPPTPAVTPAQTPQPSQAEDNGFGPALPPCASTETLIDPPADDIAREECAVDLKTDVAEKSVALTPPPRPKRAPLHFALADLANAGTESRALKPNCIQEALKRTGDGGEEFFDFEQHDAHEFLVRVLDILDTESKDFPLTTATSQRNDEGDGDAAPPRTWVSAMLSGNLLNVITCNATDCTHTMQTGDLFWVLSLDVPRPDEDADLRVGVPTPTVPTVQEALAVSIQKTQLSGYKCDACGDSEHQFQEGRFDIDQTPPVLLVHLKRFVMEFDKDKRFLGFTKNRDEVDIDEAVTIDGHTYVLQGIVSHCGMSVTYGHYVADVYDPTTKRWFNANDSDVRPLAFEKVLAQRKTTAYILCYVRKVALESEDDEGETTETAGSADEKPTPPPTPPRQKRRSGRPVFPTSPRSSDSWMNL